MAYDFETPAAPPPKTRQATSDVARAYIIKPNPQASPAKVGEIFVGHLLPPLTEQEASGLRVLGHWRKSKSKWQACKVCTEQTPNGDNCNYVNSEIERLKATGVAPGKAWSQSKASPVTLFPFYAWKAKQNEPDKFILIGSCILDMDYSLTTLFKEKARSVMKSCQDCGGEETMRHVSWNCKSCDNEIVWQDSDRTNKVNPFCTHCKERVSVVEVVKCAECGSNTPQDPEHGAWKIWSKRVKGDDGKEKNVWEIRFNSKKTLAADVTPPRIPLKGFIEYCDDFELLYGAPAVDDSGRSSSPGPSDAGRNELPSSEDIPF